MTVEQGEGSRRPKNQPKAARDFASQLFGYDFFISFALGSPPRGSHSYASDLARRLRERDLSVFFSEDEAPPGADLDSTLHKALLRSRTLVVISNRGTLQEPRWVRKEVEAFRALTPPRPIIPVSVAGALQDPQIAAEVADWLAFQGKIWVDETREAAERGIASAAVVERLILAPRRVRTNVRWRWLVRIVGTALVLLAIGLAFATKVARDQTKVARDQKERAVAELTRSVIQRAAAESSLLAVGERAGGQERALQQLEAAQRLGGTPVQLGNDMASVLLTMAHQLRLVDTGGVLRAVSFNPDPKTPMLVTAGMAGVQRWDARSLKKMGELLPGPQREVYAVQFSPDGTRIAAGDVAGRLWLWETQSGRILSKPQPTEYAPAIRSLTFSADGRLIWSSGPHPTLRWWSGLTGESVGGQELYGGEVTPALALHAASNQLASGGDAHLELMKNDNGEWISHSLEEFVPSSPAGGSRSEEAADAPAQGDEAAEPEFYFYQVESLAFSPDGRLLAAGGSDGRVHLWDTETEEPIAPNLELGKGTITSLRFSLDGRALFVVSKGGSIDVYSLAAQNWVEPWLKNQDGAVTGIDVDPSSGRLVSVDEGGFLRLWASNEEEVLGQLAPTKNPEPTGCSVQGQFPGRVLTASADCSLLAVVVAGREPALQIFRSGSVEPLGAPVKGHQTGEVRDRNSKDPAVRITSAAFSPDGRYLVSASENQTVQRWEVSPLGTRGAPLRGHRDKVMTVAFSPDGETIASGGRDGLVYLWDAETGQSLGKPFANGNPVERVFFSRDGTALWAMLKGSERSARKLPTPKGWREAICAKLMSDMTPDEWSAWLSAEVSYRPQCADWKAPLVDASSPSAK